MEKKAFFIFQDRRGKLFLNLINPRQRIDKFLSSLINACDLGNFSEKCAAYSNVRQLAPKTISPGRFAPSFWTIRPQSLDDSPPSCVYHCSYVLCGRLVL